MRLHAEYKITFFSGAMIYVLVGGDLFCFSSAKSYIFIRGKYVRSKQSLVSLYYIIISLPQFVALNYLANRELLLFVVFVAERFLMLNIFLVADLWRKLLFIKVDMKEIMLEPDLNSAGTII